MVLGNENDYMTGYKRNSVTEWLQKTGQAKNDGNFSDEMLCKFFFFIKIMEFNNFNKNILYSIDNNK